MDQVESILGQIQVLGAVAADPMERHAPTLPFHAVSNGSASTDFGVV
jgi:hypothetical protein